MAGLTPTGFEAKDLDIVLSEAKGKVRGELGDDVNLSAGSVLGTVTGIVSEGIAETWKVMQALYDGFSRGNASGVQLDNLAALIGLERRGAVATTGFVSLTGPGTPLVPLGSLMETAGGDRVRTTAVANVGDTGLAVEALQSGPIDLSGGLSPVTVIAGWTGVTVTSQFVGRHEESDGELRMRMRDQSEIIGAATVEAIRADLLQNIPDVISVLVAENITDTVDANGLPGHSFRAYLYPPTLDKPSIARRIWLTKPAGIRTSGSELVNVEDSQGFLQPIEFSFATSFPLELRVTRSPGPDYPGDAAVIATVQEFALGLAVNEAVKPFLCLCLLLDTYGGSAFETLVVAVRKKGTGAYQVPPLAVAPFTIGVVEDPADITVV